MKTGFCKTAIAALMLASASFASALDFKGVEIGAQTTPEEVENKLGVKCGLGFSGMQVCNGSVTIAREPAIANVVISSVGRVQRIRLSLSSDSFDFVATELIRKFGKPNSDDQSMVQNRFGANFRQVRYMWLGEDGVLLKYLKYSSDLTQSDLYFSTSEDRKLLERITGDRAADI